MCTGLWVKRSGSPVESMCYDFGLNSLFSQCLSTARSINGHWWIVKEACWNARCNVTKDWHAKKTEISSHWMGYLAWAQTFHLKCCEKNLSFSSFTEKKKNAWIFSFSPGPKWMEWPKIRPINSKKVSIPSGCNLDKLFSIGLLLYPHWHHLWGKCD